MYSVTVYARIRALQRPTTNASCLVSLTSTIGHSKPIMCYARLRRDPVWHEYGLWRFLPETERYHTCIYYKYVRYLLRTTNTEFVCMHAVSPEVPSI